MYKRQLLAKEEFPAALALLKEARRVATTAVHHPKPGSPLALNLDALETLEQKIYDEQAGYLRLMQQLAEISTLMNQFEAHTAEARPLHEARAQMAALSDSERDHPEARKRLVRLSQLQTVGDNWRQGQAAYHRGQWADAIELLKRVADQKEVKESPEAEKLMKRAEAARDILSAEKDEIAGNYAAALSNYKSADDTFVEYGDDSHTAELRAKALEGMARMARRTANNTKVETILAEAERNLVSLRTRVDERRGLAAKVMPIADFKQLTETLSAALAIESTLKNEVEAKWSQARYDWLKAYRAGFAIADRLAQADPGNAGWQHDLSISYSKIGAIFRKTGDRANALGVLEEGQAIMVRLTQASPDNALWKQDLTWFNEEIAELHRHIGRSAPPAR